MKKFLIIAAVVIVLLGGFYVIGSRLGDEPSTTEPAQTSSVIESDTEDKATVSTADTTESVSNDETDPSTTVPPTTAVTVTEPVVAPSISFDLSTVPAYSGSPYAEVNNNKPFFTESDYTVSSYEYYSPLDRLQRCGYAVACVGTDIMPTEARGEIGNIRPSGWHTQRYDDLIEDRYLYNRCHLIAYQLTGENDNPMNLITGTRYMNVEGMLPFEIKASDYVTYTGNHVLYRSTPIFEGDNLVATGVLMEAYSVEDNGKGLSFCVFTYNVQPGIVIDYATGDSWREETPTETTTEITRDLPFGDPAEDESESEEKEVTYILNSNTGKFHYPTCSSVSDMKEKNKVYFYGTREEAIAKGYVPCKRCNP